MTDTELHIRKHHVPSPTDVGSCVWCDDPFPCPPLVLCDAVDEVRRRCRDRVDQNPFQHGPDTTWITVADVLLALDRGGPV